MTKRTLLLTTALCALASGLIFAAPAATADPCKLVSAGMVDGTTRVSPSSLIVTLGIPAPPAETAMVSGGRPEGSGNVVVSAARPEGSSTGNVVVSAGRPEGSQTGGVMVSAGRPEGSGNVVVSAARPEGSSTGSVVVSAGRPEGSQTGGVMVSAGRPEGSGNVVVSAARPEGSSTGNVVVSAGRPEGNSNVSVSGKRPGAGNEAGANIFVRVDGSASCDLRVIVMPNDPK